jgi:hypothetical protein
MAHDTKDENTHEQRPKPGRRYGRQPIGLLPETTENPENELARHAIDKAGGEPGIAVEMLKRATERVTAGGCGK